MKRNLLKLSVIAVLVGGSALATAVDNTQELKNKVEDLEYDLNNLINDYDAYETEVGAKLDQHSDTLGRHTTRLNNLKTIADKAKADSSEALDKIEAIEEQNDEFLENITTLEESIDDLDDNLEHHESLIADNSSKIADNASKIAANELKVSENRKDINKNASRITDIRNKQVLQNARLDNHGERIDANKAAIEELEGQVDDVEEGIANLEYDVHNNTSNIATNKAVIATHTQRLDNLDNRVNNLNKDLKRGLASQAALNGLFQPYNVGKLNLTAAVGGYKSQTAVAVGTGYRHNENVATKAGIAFTHGGSATYNVGVNFEW